jgi:crotonobetainyl-CoA:carnitine CoA-transferase CaiB-like acyl-CoA transferase
MSVTGEPDGPELKVGVALVDVLTGAHAAAAILAALVGRLRHGEGAHIDIALFEVGVASLVNVTQSALATGEPARRHGNAHPQIVPYQTFEAADGPLVIAVGNDAQWRRLCQALDAPELADHPGWEGNPGRVRHREAVIAALATRIARSPRATWLERLGAARVPAGPVRGMDEVVRDPALAARDMVRTAAIGTDTATTPLLALPWRSDGVRPPLRLPPPRLGEHTDAFRARFAPERAGREAG